MITDPFRVDVEAQLPSEEQPRGVPIAAVRIEPLDAPDNSQNFLNVTCPIFVDGRRVGTMLITRVRQYGYGEVSAWLHGVARSDLRTDAFLMWGEQARARLKFDGAVPTGVDLSIGTRLGARLEHRAAIDPQVRGPIDADGLQQWLKPVLLKDLPFPHDMHGPRCMAYQYTTARRALRRLFPRRISDCCDYHRVNWRQASRIALQVAREAYSIPGWDDEAFRDYEFNRLQEMLPGPQSRHDLRDAVSSLLSTGVGIIPSYPDADIDSETGSDFGSGRADSYVNGRHRVQVMLDQGVRRTLIGQCEYGELLAHIP